MVVSPNVVESVGLSYQEMSKRIEEALRELWPQYMGDFEFPETGNKQYELLFKAIAKGVIQHLQDRASEGFDVDVMVTHYENDNWRDRAEKGTVTIKTRDL